MKKKYDLKNGERFHNLTIIREISPEIQIRGDGHRQKIRRVECLCDCGSITTPRLIMVRNGSTKSCGCLVKKTNSLCKQRTTHGLTKHVLYDIYSSMKQRCYDKNHRAYHNYGGRGIKVCDEWLNDFIVFYQWAIVNGWKKKLQIDRYPNNDGNYEPANCRVATPKQNCNNTRKNFMVKIDGKEVSLTIACESLGLDYQKIWQRIKTLGYSFEEAINF